MSNEQCALAPDGSLLDAKDIEFIYDPDDPIPMPVLGESLIFILFLIYSTCDLILRSWTSNQTHRTS